MSGIRRAVKVQFVRPYSHRIIWIPRTVPDTVAGAVNNPSGVAAGLHEIPVDGFTQEDVRDIEENMDRGVYVQFSGHEGPYRLVHHEKTGSDITKLWVFPALDNPVADDEIITANPPINMGLVGEDGLKITGEVVNDELIDETENVVEVIQHLTQIGAEFQAITMDYDNFLLIHPLSFFVVSDANVNFKYGIKKGFANAPAGTYEIADKNNPTLISRIVTFEEALLMPDSFEWGLGKEMLKGFPVKIRSTGDDLITIGDTQASYA